MSMGARKDVSALLAELVAELRHANMTQTQEWAKVRSHIVNQVLSSALYVLDSNGIAGESFVTPYGSVAIANHGTADVTITSGPPQGQAPGRGKGVGRVGAGAFEVINLTGTEWTLYGGAGGLVTVQTFVRPQPPMGSASSTAQGAAAALAGAWPVKLTDGAALLGSFNNPLVSVPTPAASLALVDSATGAAGAAVSATLTPAGFRTAWLTGIEVTSDPATALTTVEVTVTGPAVTMRYQHTVMSTEGAQLIVPVAIPIPGAAVGTAIVVSVPAIAGAVHSVAAHGFQF